MIQVLIFLCRVIAGMLLAYFGFLNGSVGWSNLLKFYIWLMLAASTIMMFWNTYLKQQLKSEKNTDKDNTKKIIKQAIDRYDKHKLKGFTTVIGGLEDFVIIGISAYTGHFFFATLVIITFMFEYVSKDLVEEFKKEQNR